MSVFGNRNNGSDYVTRSEAQGALGAYVTKEAAGVTVDALKAEAQGAFISRTEGEAALRALEARVVALETLASDLRRSNSAVLTATPLPAREGTGTTSVSTTGVDTGAIAFGLKEIARKVGEVLTGTPGLDREYVGVVQYFADVLAKADSSFDEALFKQQAGV